METSPSSSVVYLGTSGGAVLVIEVTNVQKPRCVYSFHPHKYQVNFLRYVI